MLVSILLLSSLRLFSSLVVDVDVGVEGDADVDVDFAGEFDAEDDNGFSMVV